MKSNNIRGSAGHTCHPQKNFLFSFLTDVNTLPDLEGDQKGNLLLPVFIPRMGASSWHFNHTPGLSCQVWVPELPASLRMRSVSRLSLLGRMEDSRIPRELSEHICNRKKCFRDSLGKAAEATPPAPNPHTYDVAAGKSKGQPDQLVMSQSETELWPNTGPPSI